MKRQGGVVIVAAIFILVVLAGLGAFAVSISTSQQVASALDAQSARAYQAARAGLEWGLYQSLVASTGNCPGTPDSSIYSFAPPAPTLSAMVVTVVCTKAAGTNAGPAVIYLTATACNQPTAGWTGTTVACPNTGAPTSLYVERQITVAL